MYRTRSFTYLVASVFVALVVGCQSAAQSVSDQPDTPFKLATFEAGGDTTVGLVLGERVLAIGGASDHLVSQAQVSAMTLPNEMRAVIEQYDTVSKRLYQIANYFSTNSADGHAFAHDLASVSIKAPIKYPWNVLAAAANYKAHAVGMSDTNRSSDENAQPPSGRRGGFDPSRIDDIVPERDAPVMFAKSPRSCIIDPGEPYYIPPGRERIDWEGEMAIIIGKPAYLVTQADAHDHVFGYSIMYDVSDRGGRTREVNMFPGPNWFDGKEHESWRTLWPVHHAEGVHRRLREHAPRHEGKRRCQTGSNDGGSHLERREPDRLHDVDLDALPGRRDRDGDAIRHRS